MAKEINYGAEEHLFLGTDKTIDYEIFKDDGIDEDLADGSPNPAKTMEDVSTWELAWAMAKAIKGPPAFTKRTSPGTGITIVGIYNISRTVNTQRVRVSLEDIDTDLLKAAVYYYGLKRMTDGAEEILTFGTMDWQKNPAPDE
jgi:hypothetical protein